MQQDKKHWFNNTLEEKLCQECPDGWFPGRLPISETTRQKHIENNGMHKLSEEQKVLRKQKIKNTIDSRDINRKKEISLNISNATKGKHKGNIPWNKGKKGVQQAWNKGLKITKSKEQIQHMINSRNETMLKNNSKYGKPKGSQAWNKGLHYNLSEESRIHMVDKMINSKRINNSFNKSTPEDIIYSTLVEKYGEQNIYRQYKDSRYPFSCDFYVKNLDLFIECNFHWSHGNHLFNKNCDDDINLLKHWQQKSIDSDFYKNAIETWTIRDVEKYNYFTANDLNYKIYYTLEEALNDIR